MIKIVEKYRSSVMFLGVFFLSVAIISCGGKSQSTDKKTASDTEPAIDNSQTEISMIVQEYNEDNIIEIPMISYDGQQSALTRYNGKNPEIEMLNNDIKNGITQEYNNFRDDEEGFWMEIKTYPFTNKHMIQFVMTSILLPNYATEGNIVSYNFDKVNNEWISVDTALERLGIDQTFVVKDAKRRFVPGNKNEVVDKIEVAGFRYINKEVTEFFLKIFVENPDADPWDGFFSYIYTTKNQTLAKLDADSPFDLKELDVMNPPLYYAREK